MLPVVSGGGDGCLLHICSPTSDDWQPRSWSQPLSGACCCKRECTARVVAVTAGGADAAAVQQHGPCRCWRTWGTCRAPGAPQRSGVVQVLLFSNSTRMLNVVEDLLLHHGRNYRRLDGRTSKGDRQTVIHDFNHRTSVTVFIISTSAGGPGPESGRRQQVRHHRPQVRPCALPSSPGRSRCTQLCAFARPANQLAMRGRQARAHKAPSHRVRAAGTLPWTCRPRIALSVSGRPRT